MPRPSRTAPGPRAAVRPVTALLAALLAALAVAGCEIGAADTPVAVVAPDPTVPDVVGEPLDRAKATLRAARFDGESQDLLQERDQLFDDNWVVCTQDPDSDPAPAGTVVVLGVVRTDELCPGEVPSTTPTPTAPSTTPSAAAAVPVPRPAPRPAPVTEPIPTPERTPEPTADPTPAVEDPDGEPVADSGGDSEGDADDGPGEESGEDSGEPGDGSRGTVNPGSFCTPPGAGVSSTGKPMVCAPGSDGRNRWRGR